MVDAPQKPALWQILLAGIFGLAIILYLLFFTAQGKGLLDYFGQSWWQLLILFMALLLIYLLVSRQMKGSWVSSDECLRCSCRMLGGLHRYGINYIEIPFGEEHGSVHATPIKRYGAWLFEGPISPTLFYGRECSILIIGKSGEFLPIGTAMKPHEGRLTDEQRDVLFEEDLSMETAWAKIAKMKSRLKEVEEGGKL